MKRFIALTTLLLIAGSGIFFWWQNGLGAVNAKDTTQKMFVITPGSNVRDIANNLKAQGFIKDPVVFFLLVKQKGLDKKIQAGDFRLSPSMNATTLADALTHGTVDIWVTIPEGKRAEEIAEILKEKIPTYEDSWVEELKENEGYLFPDTYLLPRESDITSIITRLRTTFNERYSSIDGTTEDVKEKTVIIASLIEREAKLDEDRPLVSSVIHNRLNIGMKLDIDATLQYMLGYQANEKRWWKSSLTNDDKAINSAYNTYKRAGLPPTPISNPGLTSLRAALHPATTNYFYYITDKTGRNRYGRTLEEHEANIAKYGL